MLAHAVYRSWGPEVMKLDEAFIVPALVAVRCSEHDSAMNLLVEIELGHEESTAQRLQQIVKVSASVR